MGSPRLLVAISLHLLTHLTLARVQIKCKSSRPDFCVGTDYNSSLTQRYTCGDPRLGPATLPTKLPLDAVTDIYDPFGGLCPGAFLTTWFNTTSGYYNFPPLGGFATDTAGNPIQAEFTLQPGVVLDRFGSERGFYMAPAAAPYMQRALPPSNLDTPVGNPEFPYNYHVYVVQTPICVSAGPIGPWFGQPGQGVQYKTPVSVEMLVAQGVLERVDPSYLVEM